MTKKVQDELRYAYALIPYRRNQDVVKIYQRKDTVKFIASIVDGHNNPAHLLGNKPGRTVANFVAERYPQQFLTLADENISQKAEKAALLVDEQVMKQYPSWASAVGAFLFSSEEKDILVALGSVFVYLWNGSVWEKPKDIGNYSLDPNQYPMDVSRFFGYRNLKEQDVLYSVKPDTIVLSPKKPLLIGTDGTEELLSLDDINTVAKVTKYTEPHTVISQLEEIMRSRSNLQNDDATIFLKM